MSLTDVLIAAKLLAKGEHDASRYPALRRVGATNEDGGNALEEFADETRSVRASLGE